MQFRISDQGLACLQNLGIAAHPRTVKTASKLSAAFHLDNVTCFFQQVAANKHFLVFCIDDYHNIHTKRHPETSTQTQTIHMITLLVKIFPNVKAISKESFEMPLLPVCLVQQELVLKLVKAGMGDLSQTYAANMPDWVLAKYFNPQTERQRLLVHDYQQTEIPKMICMENIKLTDSL